MDLLTYAVNRKLTQSEDPLLEYVSRGENVPVNVLESSFKELLRPLEDEKSTLLVEDYLKMLERYVPVQYTGNQPDGTYKVTGEISENLLEAINLVHGKGQEEVISEMISQSTKQITNRPVNVGDISLTELTRQMENLTENMAEVQDFDEIEDEDLVDEVVEGVVDEVSEEVYEDEDLVDEVVEGVVDETFEEEYDEVSEEVYEDEEETAQEETYEEYEEEQLEEEEAFQETYEEEPAEEQEYVEAAEELLEEMSEEEVEELESKMLMDGIKRVYTRLVEDLKAYGLDKSLGLSL